MIFSNQEQRFKQALKSQKPFEIPGRIARALRDEGASRTDVYFLSEHHQEKTASEDELHDAIVDTMDEIHGGPWAKGGGFFSATLTAETICTERQAAYQSIEPTPQSRVAELGC